MFRNRISIAIATVVVVLGFGIFMQIHFDNSDDAADSSSMSNSVPVTEAPTTSVSTDPVEGVTLSYADIVAMPVAREIPINEAFDDVVEIDGGCEFRLTIVPGESYATSASTCFAGLYILMEDQAIEAIPIIANGAFAGSAPILNEEVSVVFVACPQDDYSGCQAVKFVRSATVSV